MDSVGWARAHMAHGKIVTLPPNEAVHRDETPWYPTLTNVTESLILSASIKELVSLETPRLPPSASSDDAWWPIDVLFGCYNAMRREITIFDRNIVDYARRLGCNPAHFAAVVRTHEWAHAFVHLAIPRSLEAWAVSPEDPALKKQWGSHLRHRTLWYRALDESAHEYLAQAITYSVMNGLVGMSPHERAPRVECFDALESRQSPTYQLSLRDKQLLVSTRWQVVLRALVLHAFNEGFKTAVPKHIVRPNDWREGIAELISLASDPPRTHLIDVGQMSVQLEARSQWTTASQQQVDTVLELVVARIGNLRLSIYSKEHPPPHFNVTYGNESANYRLDDGEQINGGLTRYRGKIREYYTEHREQLIKAWNERRPSDCSVGEVMI